MKSERITQAVVFCLLVSVAVTVRLVSDMPNFNAVTAAALFAGFYFRRGAIAMAVPVSAMAISDLFLGGYERPVMIAVYGSLLIPIAWRSMLRSQLTPARVAVGTLSSTLAFFVITNAAVWYTWYAHTWAGAAHCYVKALAFLHFSLASDLLFAAAYFGLYVLATRLNLASRPAIEVGATSAA